MTRIALGLAAGLLAATPALAVTTYYASRASFEADLAALGAVETTQTFNGLAGGTQVSSTVGGRGVVTVGNLTISSTRSISAQSSGGDIRLFTAFSQTAPRNLIFSIPTAAIAYGLDLIEYQSPDTAGLDPITVAGLGTAQVLNSTAAPTFFGVIDPDGSTTSFNITRSQTVLYPITFDNVSFASLAATAVPEPASLALLAIGVAASLRRRRR